MCMGGAPSAPAAAPLPAPTPPPPTAVDPSVLAARQNAADNARTAAGIGSTVAPGDLDTGSSGNKKTLLGL